jgi:trigger factor
MDSQRVTLEDLSPVRKRLTIEIPADAVSAELERALEVVGRQARLRGFRPGKAPRSVVERVFGPDIRREVLERLVERSFHEALESHGLSVVGAPDIDADPVTPGEALRYSATVDVRPRIVLGDLGGLRVTVAPVTVTDDDVSRALDAMREAVAQLRPIEDRAVIDLGDVVTLDVTSRIEGQEPVRRQDVLVEAGAGAFPLALERQIVGQHRGARLSLGVPYPADHSNPGIAGRTVQFDVEIKDLRAKEVPPLDDDFARDHGRCDSVADLRTRVRADLERDAQMRSAQSARDELLDQLIARHPFEVPQTLVDRRLEALVATLDLRGAPDADREAALARLRDELRPRAERQVRVELLLDAVAERAGITVNDEDVRAEIDAIAARERQVPERVRALYERDDARAALRARIARERAIAGLMESSGARAVPHPAAESVAHEK